MAAAALGAPITSSQVLIARPPSACSPIHDTDRYLPGPSAASGVLLRIPCSFS